MSMPPSCVGRVGDPRLDGLAVGCVDAPCRSPAPTADSSLTALLDVLGRAGADRYRRALGQQRLGDRPPESLRGAGDQRSLALQSEIHLEAPLLVSCDPR